MRRALLPIALAACGGNEQFMIVTIESVPAVHDVAKIEVELDNDGTTRGDSFEVNNPSFPATFSISSGAGTTGALSIAITARDENGLLVGSGNTATQFEELTAKVRLDSADFVINTDFAADQFPSQDFESHGFQVGATSAGTWTAVYRDNCSAPCNMFARRFDVTGKPLSSGLAAGTNGFPVSTELSDGFFTTPATASAGTTTIAAWNFSEPSPSTANGVACRAMDDKGNGIGDQVTIATETAFPFAVAVAPLSNGSFAVTWQASDAGDEVIRSVIVDAQCTPSNQANISTVAGTVGPIRSSVATNGNNVIYGWVLDNNARIRVMDQTNQQVSGDLQVAAKDATDEVGFVRVTKLGAGFGVFVRWATIAGTGAGRIELIKTSASGQIQGSPVVITNKTSSDFDSVQGFSVATRDEDGAILVVWHSCGEISDGSGCGVFGRLVDSGGTPVGAEFNLATTVQLDQTAPSVVALPGAFAAVWKDTSGQEPDVAGSAVRGRVVYPTATGSPSSKRGELPRLFDLRF